MARKISGVVNAKAPSTAYPYGQIQDDGVGVVGTTIDEKGYGDIHTFFQTLMNEAGITYSEDAEKVVGATNDEKQLITALESKILTYVISKEESWRYIGGSGFPPFLNQWHNIGIGYTPLRMKLDIFGYVIIEGFITTTDYTNTQVYTYGGFSPAYKKKFSAYDNVSKANIECEVNQNGELRVYATGNGQEIYINERFKLD